MQLAANIQNEICRIIAVFPCWQVLSFFLTNQLPVLYDTCDHHTTAYILYSKRRSQQHIGGFYICMCLFYRCFVCFFIRLYMTLLIVGRISSTKQDSVVFQPPYSSKPSCTSGNIHVSPTATNSEDDPVTSKTA